jgi:Cu+-exporting ATPase
MSQQLNIESVACLHCGEPAGSSPIRKNNQVFCCEGCSSVYQILSDNQLCDYYKIDSTPGSTMKAGIERKKFDYLIDREVVEKLVAFKNANVFSVSFLIPNIHCTSCVWLLENLHKIDEGILQGTVNFLKRTLTILYDDNKTDLRNIVELLTTVGYEPDLKLQQLSGSKKTDPQRSIWLKLGVAGFCFGNIMLFSFPEYLNISGSDSIRSFSALFGALNIILALPVLFYSSIDYLKSAWAAISQKGINLDVPISLGILALFGRSLYEILSGTGTGYFDSFTGFIFFLLIGKLIQKKTFQGLSFDRDYKSYLPISVLRIEQGEEQSVSVNKTQIGDLIRIRNNELLPCDSILESDSAVIDYSFITGESDPITKQKGDLIFAGGRILGRNAVMLVSKKVEQSYLTQLWENDNLKYPANKTLTGFADRISPYFTISVIFIAVLSCIIWLQIEPTKAFTIFTAVLIVACPCALALSSPFTFGSATNILSFNNFYLRKIDGIEVLGSIKNIVFDKTGTITHPENSRLLFKGETLSDYELNLIRSSVKNSIHPYSKKIFNFLHPLNDTIFETEHFEESKGRGIHAKVGGQDIHIGSKSFIKSETGIDNDLPVSEKSHVYVALNYQLKGCFEFENTVRKGLNNTLEQLKKNYHLELLSGDNKKDGVLLGNYFGGWDNMYFNQSPIQKKNHIASLKKERGDVLMIGDGLNDAGGLQVSDFGIAITDKVSSFSPACDGILEAKSLPKLSDILKFCQRSVYVVYASFILSLLYNLTGLAFAVSGNLSPLVAAILMPVSSITIMVFTTVTTRFIAKKMELKIWG